MFETLAANAYPVVPYSEELATCLTPGKEVLVYHSGGEMVELVRQLNKDPLQLQGLLAAGRKRVLEQHGFGARARALLSHLADNYPSDHRARAPATPVQQPKVTVYMPVHNAERFLNKALDSVLGQTWRNLSVLALDDASTDGTAGILQARAMKRHARQVATYSKTR